jgi:hypothetical protein
MRAAAASQTDAETRLHQLSGFLSGFAAAMFAAIPLELLASKHWQEPVQFIPFALSLLGLVATLAAWKRPSRSTLRALRAVAVVNAAGATYGVFEHFEGNHGFITERRSDEAGWALVKGMLTGRAPALVSGALVVAAVVELAASWAAAPAPETAPAAADIRRPVTA